MEELVITYKNGIEKTWTRRQWEILGTYKHGWAEVPQVPKEVAQAVSNEPKPAPQPVKKRKK